MHVQDMLVVYAIHCMKCTIYIGETGRRLGDRFREHRRYVLNNATDNEVSVIQCMAFSI